MLTVDEIKRAIEEAHGKVTLSPGELLMLVREIDRLKGDTEFAWSQVDGG